jgi:N-acetylglutamate synthase-like GNAT family acetyltransferase
MTFDARRMTIRTFKNDDSAAVSQLIVENLRTVNIRDYSQELMDALAKHKSPQNLEELASECDAFVAVEAGKILGVAMLYGDRITNMFVRTQNQSSGIGRSLITHIEELAKSREISKLSVDSSITALGFYIKCGYRVTRKVNKPFSGIDNVVFEMDKVL